MRNTVILCDANIMLNYLTLRDDPHLQSSLRVMKACAVKELKGYYAPHSISIIWYVLRKEFSDKDVRRKLSYVCNILNVAGISNERVLEAIDRKDFRDFEDCLQDECAVSVGANYIVTCNVKDFGVSRADAITPEDMVGILEGV